MPADNHAHEMLDQLGPGQLDAVVRLLEVLTDPDNVSIRDAPIDDEPESEEEARAVAVFAPSLWVTDARRALSGRKQHFGAGCGRC